VTPSLRGGSTTSHPTKSRQSFFRRGFAVNVPELNGDNWLLTYGPAFVDLPSPRL